MAATPLSSPHEHQHHVVQTSTYLATLAALTVLMILTVWVATFNLPDIGPISGTIVNQTVALVIASVKAILVIMIFMGVRWATPLTKLWAMTGFVWFTLMFIILADYATRKYEPVVGWEKYDSSGLPRQIVGGKPQPLEIPNSANLHPRY